MNGLQVFNYGEQKVRTLMMDDAPWWVLADVCRVLEIVNGRHVATRLDEDEKRTVALNDGSSGIGRVVVNESGLYKTILRSDKPAAKEFTRWITREVLPAIRKTGEYRVETERPTPDILREVQELDRLCAEIEQRKRKLSELLVGGTELSYELSRVLYNYLQGQYRETTNPIPLAYPPQGYYSQGENRDVGTSL